MASKWRKAFKVGAAAAVAGGSGVALLYMSSVVSAERKKEQVELLVIKNRDFTQVFDADPEESGSNWSEQETKQATAKQSRAAELSGWRRV